MIEKGKQIFFCEFEKKKRPLTVIFLNLMIKNAYLNFLFVLFCFVLNFAKNGNNPDERKLISKS